MGANLPELLAALALLALVSGMSGVTYRAAILMVLLLSYLTMLALDVPGVLAALMRGREATFESAFCTAILGAWLWVLNTILLMLARGKLGPQPTYRTWRRK